MKSPLLLGFRTATEQDAEGEALAALEVTVVDKVETVAFEKVVSVQVVETKGVEAVTTELEGVDGVNVAIVDDVEVGLDGGVTGTTLMIEIDPGVSEVSGVLEEATVVVFTVVISVVVGGTYG